MKEETVEHKDDIVSLGKKLAQLRLAKGLTVSDIANEIHVRTSIIKDIENDSVINVPPVFLKGYIKNYAAIVGLAEHEYKPDLDSKILNQPPQQAMKNYSNKEQAKKHTKLILFTSLLIILMIVGITTFLIWKENKTDLVEVTHYVSPPTSISS